MTPPQTLAVILRLFAIWLFLGGLRTLPAFFGFYGSDAPGYAYALFLFALTSVLALVLWFFPRAITGKLLPTHETQSQPGTTPDTWLAMGCSLIGLLMFSATVPRLLFDLFAFNHLENFEEHSQLRRGVLYDLIELAISAWLMLGAKGFRKIFWWAQNAGTRRVL